MTPDWRPIADALEEVDWRAWNRTEGLAFAVAAQLADPLRAPDTDDEPAYPPTPARNTAAFIAVALLAGLFALVIGRVARRFL